MSKPQVLDTSYRVVPDFFRRGSFCLCEILTAGGVHRCSQYVRPDVIFTLYALYRPNTRLMRIIRHSIFGEITYCVMCTSLMRIIGGSY